MKQGFILAAAMLAAVTQAGMFSRLERDRVLKYWTQPTRLVSQPGDFQVRLTTAGSSWLWNYNKIRGFGKVAPGTTPTPQNAAQRVWQKWIDQKIERDRWNAMKNAEAANAAAGRESKFDDRALPKTEPADPGQAPTDLVAYAGEPPVFAESVAPIQYEVVFDDGTRVVFADNSRMPKNYAYYRFEEGVTTGGTAVKNLPNDKLDKLFADAGVSAPEARVMKAVSMLEGGFDSVNTYDTGFVSVGFIQFASLKEGAGSLGSMLLRYKSDSPSAFDRDFRRFGVDVTDDGKLACLNLASGEEATGPEANTLFIRDKRLIAVFVRAGRVSDDYNAAQIRAAKSQFMPAQDIVTFSANGQSLSCRVSDVIRSEAGMATLMDRKVNTGRIDPLPSLLSRFAEANGISRIEDLCAFELDLVQALRYRKDYLGDPSLSQPAAGTRTKPLSSRGARTGRNSRSGGTGGQSR